MVSWGDADAFVQGGTDFTYQGHRVECWLRHIDYVAAIIAECQAGVVRREFVTWTVMGFYNHCTLSDLHRMVPVEDPTGVLARWQAEVSQYPPRLRETIIATHLKAARFWPENFHYQSAVRRGDILYVTGIVGQVVHHLIQVVFALNRVYFPGDKKLDAALDQLAVKPTDFSARISYLVMPGADGVRVSLGRQRQELGALVREVESLVAQADDKAAGG